MCRATHLMEQEQRHHFPKLVLKNYNVYDLSYEGTAFKAFWKLAVLSKIPSPIAPKSETRIYVEMRNNFAMLRTLLPNIELRSRLCSVLLESEQLVFRTEPSQPP